MLYRSIEELIGNTPLYLPQAYIKKHCGNAVLLCKLECMNPAGSIKDRTALFMLNDAEANGLVAPGGTIIEPTSGNTGIGLALLAAARGYRLILTMPENMSTERRALLAAYGAEIVLTPGKNGMQGAIEKAQELAESTQNSWIPSQFDNPANPRAHELTTGPELWSDAEGRIDAFVAGVGTGGTLSGVGRYLKEKDPNCKIIAVEPKGSPLLSGGCAGSHGLQGIGANFIPKNLDTGLIDEIITVSEEDAYAAAREFTRTEGLLLGISSGAALFAATRLANRPEFAGQRIAVLFPDGGEKYLSTPLYRS